MIRTDTYNTDEWRLVPVEPTENMIEAGENTPHVDNTSSCWQSVEIYKAMLEAAPEYQSAPNENLKDETWIMKDGSKIKVSDMSEEHVRNTLRLLIRTNEFINSLWYRNFLFGEVIRND